MLGYYGVHGRGDVNDAEGWSSIDEGRWKEGRRREDKRTRGQEAVESEQLKDPDDVIRKADGRRRRTDLEVIESCRELSKAV